MSDDAPWFDYDATTYHKETSGIDVEKLEVDYAELYTRALGEGPIAAETRARLDRAAQAFGLDPARLRRIEEAVRAAFEAGQRARGPAPAWQVPAARDSEAVALFGPASDPMVAALQRRIAVLEAQNAELASRAKLAAIRVAELERDLSLRTAELERNRAANVHVDVDVDLARLVEGPGGTPGYSPDDPAELHRRVRERPRDPDAYRALFRALKRPEEFDRRWCVAHALVFLGAAGQDERAVFERRRPQQLIRSIRSVAPAEWRELVFDPETDVLPGDVFSIIAPAVLLCRVATAPRDGSAALNAAMRIDPERTTVQIARCFLWSSALLGIRTPPLYAAPEWQGLTAMAIAVPPACKLGRAALAERNARELAFVAGRHLAWHRDEHFVVTLASSTRDLEDLFLAALSIGNPGLPLSADVRRRIDPVRRGIEPLLEAPALEKLKSCFLRFVEGGGRARLGAWAAAADRVSTRAGLLLANDLMAAKAMLDVEGPEHADARMDELLVYSTSERYAKLRHRIGTALRGD
jgi:hypothetical protein